MVMRSPLPAAEAFEDWVVGTVLPSIRKHGGHIAVQENATDPAVIMVNAVLVAEQTAKLTVMEPKAITSDASFANGRLTRLTQAARTLDGINTQATKKVLLRLGYFYRTASNYRVYAKRGKALSCDPQPPGCNFPFIMGPDRPYSFFQGLNHRPVSPAVAYVARGLPIFPIGVKSS